MNQGKSNLHLKIQYLLIVGGLALVVALPRAEAQSPSVLAGRISQLESRIQALNTKVQGLEYTNAYFRRVGTKLEVSAQNFVVTRDMTVNGDLLVKGNSTLGDGDVDTTTISGNASLQSNVTVGQDLSVGGDTSLGGSLAVTGQSDFNGSTYANANMWITNNLWVGDNEWVGENFYVTGDTLLGADSSTGVAILGDLEVAHSSTFGTDALSDDETVFRTPYFVANNLSVAHFNFGTGANIPDNYGQAFLVSDGNMFLRNTDGPTSTNGKGNFVIGDGLTGAGHTWRQANFANTTNSFIMGYEHWLPNSSLVGGMLSGHGHSVGSSSTVILGGYSNWVDTDYGFALGGHNNYPQRSGTGQVGGYNNNIGGNFDDWKAGIGDSVFDPN